MLLLSLLLLVPLLLLVALHLLVPRSNETVRNIGRRNIGRTIITIDRYTVLEYRNTAPYMGSFLEIRSSAQYGRISVNFNDRTVRISVPDITDRIRNRILRPGYTERSKGTKRTKGTNSNELEREVPVRW